MKIKKSLLSVFLCISLMCGCLSPSISAYASSGETTESGSNFLERMWQKSKSLCVGVIDNSIEYTKDFINFLTQHKSDYNIPEETTPQEWIDDNVTVDSQGNVIYSNNVINSMRDCVNNYIQNDTGYRYAYSYNLSFFYQLFDSQSKYQGLLEILRDNPDSGFYVADYYFYSFPNEVQLITPNPNGLYVRNIDTGRNQVYTQSTIDWQENVGFVQYYNWNSNTSSWDIGRTTENGSIRFNLSVSKELRMAGYYNSSYYITESQKAYQVFNTLNALKAKEVGVQEYYVSDAFNTSHTDNSITTTIGDINRQITYGDVSTYVNNYYTTNNNYPTTNQVYNYINNYEGSGDNGGGGGSSGDDDGISIWDSLKKVLDFISHIIDLIADFLANLVDSIGDIITSMINSIFDIFNAIKDDIPNAIGGLLEYLFPFLPSELLVFIRFSIACSIIIGLIKLIRG